MTVDLNIPTRLIFHMLQAPPGGHSHMEVTGMCGQDPQK